MATDLRKKVTTGMSQAPASAVVSTGVPNVFLPKSAGTVLNLTPEEEGYLKQLDWQAGDPVPNVAALIDQIKSETPDLSAVSEQGDLQPKVVNFDDLSAEEQKRLKEAVALSVEQAKRFQSVKMPDVESPEVAQVISDLTTGKTAQLQLEDENSDEMKTAANVPAICPNCGHNSANEIVDITDIDKQNYLYMMLGGARFQKSYPLFNGAMEITFRSLTRDEMELALVQISYDDRDGLVPTPAEYFRMHQNYEMVLSLAKIKSGKHLEPFDLPNDILWDKPAIGQPQQTVLKELYPHVMKTSLNQSSQVRLAVLMYQRFRGLILRLEANALNASFWNGIELPA